MIKVAIIGGGAIGCERIEALQKINKTYPIYIAVCEPNKIQAQNISQKYNISTYSNITEVLTIQPDWVFICTPHDVVIEIIEQIFKSGANVLIEKPLGRNLAECEYILSLKPSNVKLMIGFNYRFMKGISALLKDVKDKKFGDIISVNAILAHGNSPNILKTWKLDPIRCGNVLIDPGVHLFDLLCLMCNRNLKIDNIKTWKGFWNTGIEEEAHILLSDDEQTIYNMQVSLNRWRSNFQLEVNGVEGYGKITGRGKSYGAQSYITGKRWGWQNNISQATSEIHVVDNDPVDDSFYLETLAILTENKIINPCTDEEALKVMKLVEECKKN